jgi:hypothetical protein
MGANTEISNPDLRNGISNPDLYVALWLAIHGGDPAPDSKGPVQQMTIALSIYELANRLTDEASRHEIRAITKKAVARLSHEITR